MIFPIVVAPFPDTDQISQFVGIPVSCHKAIYLVYIIYLEVKYCSASLIFSSMLRSEEAGRVATALAASAAE